MTEFTLQESASLKELVLNHERKRENMTKMIVVCTGDASARFDRDYYANDHFGASEGMLGGVWTSICGGVFPVL